MTVPIDPYETRSLAAECAARADRLAAASAGFAAAQGPALTAALRDTTDCGVIEAGAALVADLAAGADWGADSRQRLRRVTRALYRAWRRKGAGAARMARLRSDLLALEADDTRLRTLRELLGVLKPRRTLGGDGPARRVR